jgi:hypothetical protein
MAAGILTEIRTAKLLHMSHIFKRLLYTASLMMPKHIFPHTVPEYSYGTVSLILYLFFAQSG